VFLCEVYCGQVLLVICTVVSVCWCTVMLSGFVGELYCGECLFGELYCGQCLLVNCSVVRVCC